MTYFKCHLFRRLPTVRQLVVFRYLSQIAYLTVFLMNLISLAVILSYKLERERKRERREKKRRRKVEEKKEKKR